MKLTKHLIFFAITLLPSFAFADDIFGPYPSDLSIQYLSIIFGNVEGTVVTGGGFQTLKTVLTSFNLAIMSLGAIIVLYSMMVSVVNTAHDGEMLGKDWSSMWIPLRTAMGFALLLPVKGSTSYSVIQVFVMWVVTQGIYAADYLWENSVDSVLAGQAKPPQLGTSNAQVTQLSQMIFESLVCVKQAAENLNTNPSSIGPVDGKYVFGVTGNYQPDDICGYVAEQSGVDVRNFGSGSSINLFDVTKKDKYASDTAAAQNQAIVNMIDYLGSYADDFITAYSKGASSSTDTSSIQSAVSAAANIYISQVSAAAASVSTSDDQKKFLDYTKQQGWIMAGASFLAMAQTTNDQASAKMSVPTSSYSGWGSIHEGSSSDPAIYKYLTDPSTFAKEMSAAAAASTPQESNLSSPNEITSFLTGQLNFVQDIFLGFLFFWTSMISGQSMNLFGTFGDQASQYTQSNPIIVIMTAGIWITRGIIIVYGLFVSAMIILGGVAYGAGESIFGLVGAAVGWGALVTALNFLTAPIMVLMGSLLGIGIIWGYYVPLIPYIIFTMGALGWFMLVIEAMVAAPLMAIGVLHPEGKHTVFGEAHAGIMIIAGVFLRPALMIVGLIAALIMSYVVVIIISVGFTPVATQIAVEHYSLVGLIAMMAFYTMLILIGLNKAFALIHILPDKIMRWIGQPGEQSSADQELNEMKGGAGSMEKGLSDTGSMGAQGAGAIQTQAQRIGDKEREQVGADAAATTRDKGGASAS